MEPDRRLVVIYGDVGLPAERLLNSGARATAPSEEVYDQLLVRVEQHLFVETHEATSANKSSGTSHSPSRPFMGIGSFRAFGFLTSQQ